MKLPIQQFRVFKTQWNEGQYVVSVFPTPACSDDGMKMERETLEAQQIQFIEQAIAEKIAREFDTDNRS